MFGKDYQQSQKHWEDKFGPPLPDGATQWRWIGDLTAAPAGESDFLFGGAGELDVGQIKHGKAPWGGEAVGSVVCGLADALCGYPALTRQLSLANPNSNPGRPEALGHAAVTPPLCVAGSFSSRGAPSRRIRKPASSVSTSTSLEADTTAPLDACFAWTLP